MPKFIQNKDGKFEQIKTETSSMGHVADLPGIDDDAILQFGPKASLLERITRKIKEFFNGKKTKT